MVMTFCWACYYFDVGDIERRGEDDEWSDGDDWDMHEDDGISISGLKRTTFHQESSIQSIIHTQLLVELAHSLTWWSK